MSNVPEQVAAGKNGKRIGPFRRAVLRGLAIILPPLLTIVILVWVWNTILNYVLVPIESVVRSGIVWTITDERRNVPPGAHNKVTAKILGEQQVIRFTLGDEVYVRLQNGHYIPKDVFDRVKQNPGAQMPATTEAIYHRYVQVKYLQRYRVIPIFLFGFVLFLYFTGKFVAAGMGRMAWVSFERQLLQRVPVIKQIYSSVKQVTDFVFSEREIEYTRVVAVEWPRKGVWSLGFVTGDSMLDIASAANEPIVSVLIPNSPVPATGFTISVRRSEIVDLNVTIDQALQFMVSCGVVVPQHQQYRIVGNELMPATVAGQVAEADVQQEFQPQAEKRSPSE